MINRGIRYNDCCRCSSTKRICHRIGNSISAAERIIRCIDQRIIFLHYHSALRGRGHTNNIQLVQVNIKVIEDRIDNSGNAGADRDIAVVYRNRNIINGYNINLCVSNTTEITKDTPDGIYGLKTNGTDTVCRVFTGVRVLNRADNLFCLRKRYTRGGISYFYKTIVTGHIHCGTGYIKSTGTGVGTKRLTHYDDLFFIAICEAGQEDTNLCEITARDMRQYHIIGKIDRRSIFYVILSNESDRIQCYLYFKRWRAKRRTVILAFK